MNYPPTNPPTYLPTLPPAQIPTNSPYHQPTDWWTERPTNEPTDWPTDWRTNRTTDWPTDWQTDGQTDGRTDQPNERPTDRPTDRPTNQPTNRPTDWPISSYPQSLHYKFNLNENWREINIPLCQVGLGFLSCKKMDTDWFLWKKLKIFDPKLIWEIKWTLRVLLYHFKILNNTFSLIPNLLKSKKEIKNDINLCNNYKSCWYRL